MGSAPRAVELHSEFERQVLRTQRSRAAYDRRAVVLDPKARTIGIDVSALDQQNEERRWREEDQRRVERKADLDALEVARQVQLQARERHCNQLAANVEEQRFRFERQKREDSREFILNDPDRLKKDRLPLDREQLSASSIQKFLGEDLQQADRVRGQHDQMKHWIVQTAQENVSIAL